MINNKKLTRPINLCSSSTVQGLSIKNKKSIGEFPSQPIPRAKVLDINGNKEDI